MPAVVTETGDGKKPPKGKGKKKMPKGKGFNGTPVGKKKKGGKKPPAPFPPAKG